MSRAAPSPVRPRPLPTGLSAGRRRLLAQGRLIALLLLLAGQAQAFDQGGFSFFFNNEFTYQYNDLAEDNHQYYDSFSFFGKYGQWSGGLTLRGLNYYPQNPNTTLEKSEWDLYRKFIQYSTDTLTVQAGDFYAMLGRGLTLSVLQDEATLRERTIGGGEIRYNLEKIRLRALGGSVSDEQQLQKWWVGGGECIVEYFRKNRLGGHVSFIKDAQTFLNLSNRWTWSVSAAGDNLWRHLNYYAEYGRLDREGHDWPDGTAFYASLSFSHSHISWLAEYKDYDHFDNQLNNPPPADYGEEINVLEDSAGGRLLFQYSFFDPDVIVFASAGRYREFTDTGNHYSWGVTAEDLAEKVSASFSCGVRDLYYPVWKTNASLLYRLTERLSAQVTFKDKRYQVAAFKFNEQDWVFQIGRSALGSGYFQYQHSEQPINERRHFYSGGIRLELWQGSYVEAAGGTMRGGEICSNGQCFFMPPFEGFKLTLCTIFR